MGRRWHTIDGSVWRTTYHIVYCGPAELSDSIIEVLNGVDRSLSAFNEGGVLAAINRGDTTVKADRRFIVVFEESKRVWEASEGRFDPTLGAAIRVWGFGPGGKVTHAPSDQAIDSVRALVGLGECGVTMDGRVIKKHPLTEFNFSAIAKGFACDEVGEMLRRNGVTDYLVEIGGEIAVSGRNEQGEPWRIMVDAPGESGADGVPVHERLTCVELTQGGIATSGNYRNFRDYDGSGRVGHTIDPFTCRPAERSMLSATVTAPTAMLADALATACMAGSPEQARQLIGKFEGAGCLIVLPDSTVKIFGKFPNLR